MVTILSITRAHARGFLPYGNCDKPRLIYSDSVPRRMVPLVVSRRVSTVEVERTCQALAEETLKEACASHACVRGAGLYDSGRPFKDVFIITPSTLA
jgi:hypothetical protein